MLSQVQTVRATVDATVWVHRDTNTDLAAAARDALARATDVSDVGSLHLRGVRPGATDVRVRLTAEVTVRVDADADRTRAVERAVGDGVRVLSADARRVDTG
jgi:hypothetical protein